MSDVFSAKRQEQVVACDPASTAILVVDMLNDFCNPKGLMPLPGWEALLEPQRRVIAAGRAKGCPIIFIVDAHRPQLKHDREFMKRSPHCMENQWGSAVIAELAPQPDDIIMLKRRFSGFFNTDLDLTLKDLRVHSLIYMGVVTNICVRSTVHDAFFLGYQNIIVKDAVAATGAREQASSLYDMATHFGSVSFSQSVAAHLTTGEALELWDPEA